jgi:LytS/YehU family sensor histidine kinase
VRFGDRLDVSVTATLDAAAARVPLLVVQPLVENSLRHGFASRIAPGHIAICARRERDALVIDVVDDGIGLPQGWSIASGNGTGLRTLASRLEAEYGDRQSLSVAPRQHGGVHVTVRLPYEAA